MAKLRTLVRSGGAGYTDPNNYYAENETNNTSDTGENTAAKERRAPVSLLGSQGCHVFS